MSKERRTVSLDEEVEQYLSGEGVNASQLVNKLVKTHAKSGGNKRAMLELREDQLVSEIEELHGRIQSKEDELESVREQLAEFEDEKERKIAQAKDALTERDLVTESQAVRFWADELDMSVEELKQEVEGNT